MPHLDGTVLGRLSEGEGPGLQQLEQLLADDVGRLDHQLPQLLHERQLAHLSRDTPVTAGQPRDVGRVTAGGRETDQGRHQHKTPGMWILGCITYHVTRCSYDFIMPIYTETHSHVSFFNFHPHPARGNQSFEITLGGQKIRY